MRGRRKKNLEPRLEQCRDVLVIMNNSNLNYELSKTEKHLIDFKSLFGNSNPVVLEVGCGKGAFAAKFASRNPDLNILGVEVSRNVIVSACEAAKKEGLKNVKFLCGSAEYLRSYIKSGSINDIYLNFSCPFPKNSYARHRLTHPHFLEIYSDIMAPGAKIFQKTDNARFFEFSIKSLNSAGFLIDEISLDLYENENLMKGNIETEYEHRFTAQGKPIYYLAAKQ